MVADQLPLFAFARFATTDEKVLDQSFRHGRVREGGREGEGPRARGVLKTYWKLNC